MESGKWTTKIERGAQRQLESLPRPDLVIEVAEIIDDLAYEPFRPAPSQCAATITCTACGSEAMRTGSCIELTAKTEGLSYGPWGRAQPYIEE